MSQHRRRTRRTQQERWDAPPLPREDAPTSDENVAASSGDYFDQPHVYGDDLPDMDWGQDPVNKADAPQVDMPPPRRRMSRENLILTVILLAALIIAIVFGTLIYLQSQSAQEEANAAPTAVPYDVTQPFLPSDITPEQMTRIEENGGSFALMDYETGPHGIKIGHSLDTLLSRFPLTYTQNMSDGYTWDETSQNMSALSYDYLETDYQVLYAARVFYLSGEMIVLPPSGTMQIGSDQIQIMLTAPLAPYPEGTAENYLAYPHVYCRLTVDPDTSKITRIVLGKNE